jgi:glycosyltransferase involved in cell wall biosynthesis
VASFDLIVATVDRTDELQKLFASLERQTHRDFRVIVVDQNDDERVAPLLQARRFEIVRLTSPRGLSRARNTALGEVRSEIVAFPDDDCVYPDDLLERLAHRFTEKPSLDALTGRGGPSPPWKPDAAILTRENLWNRAVSYTMFLRAGLVARVGAFDEELGLGSGRPWSSGEEIDYLIRALQADAHIEYDPNLVVEHAPNARELRGIGVRDGASVGYLLRKHRYPHRTLVRMAVRPLGGALCALAKRDGERARFHVATLRGRLAGYRGR